MLKKTTPQPLLILEGYVQKEFYNSYLDEYITSLRNRIRFRRACRLADAKHKETGKAYYVINGGRQGLVIFNNLERKELVRRKFLKKNADHLSILSVAMYYTMFPPKTRKDLEKREYNRLKTYLKIDGNVRK